jgi:hypothetical protein
VRQFFDLEPATARKQFAVMTPNKESALWSTA